jgi:hypothetical protein
MYPKPDLSDSQPNFVKTAENERLDIGWNEGELSDGHPYRMDVWCLDGTTNLTFFVAREGLSDRSDEEWADLLESEGLIRYAPHVLRSVFAVPVVDAVGMPIWSLNVMVGCEDELFLADCVPHRVYARP